MPLSGMEDFLLSLCTEVQGPLWYRDLAFGDEAPRAAHADALLERHGAALDPAPSPLLRYLEGREPVPPIGN